MIYYITDTPEYEFIDCITSEGYRIFRYFDGTPRAENWHPIPVERVLTDDDGSPLLPADLLWLSASEVFMRTREMDALRDLLEEGGEVLPLATRDGVELSVLNVTRVLDALDEERSTVERFDDGTLMFIVAPAFHESIVRDVPFFKLPHFGSEIFAGDAFVQRVRDAGLVGIAFTPAWSSQGGPVRRTMR